jgi:DNA-binding cell septation regulator SpoVG
MTQTENGTRVTEVRLSRTARSDKMVASGTVVLNDDFVVHIRLIVGDKGSTVVMPENHVSDECRSCRRTNRKDARFCNWCGAPVVEAKPRRFECCHPLNREMRKIISDIVVDAYEQMLEGKLGQISLRAVLAPKIPTASEI